MVRMQDFLMDGAAARLKSIECRNAAEIIFWVQWEQPQCLFLAKDLLKIRLAA